MVVHHAFWYPASGQTRALNSCRYRMAALCAHIPQSALWMGDEHGLVRSKPQVCSLIRPRLDKAAWHRAEALKHQGCRLVFDYDDLLFCGDAEDYPFVLAGRVRVDQVRRMQGEYRRAMALADGFTVATEALAAALEPYAAGRPICVVPNGLADDWLALPEVLLQPWQPGDPRVIRYCAGSASHDRDLARVLPQIRELMLADSSIEFEAIGTVQIAEGMLPQGRYRRLPYLPYAQLPMVLASAWVTIAPLMPTRFNRAKSAIKFLESAAWGTPCIASWHGDMESCRPGGVLIARNRLEWLQSFAQLRDDAQRQDISQRGRAWVRSHRRAAQSAVTLAQFCERWYGAYVGH